MRSVRMYVGAVVVCATACAGAAPAAFAARPVQVIEEIGGLGPQERPPSLGIGPDTVADRLAWSSWGDDTAQATGMLVGYGSPEVPPPAPATVTLSRLRRCGHYRLYTRGTVDAGEVGGPYALRIRCRVHAVASHSPGAAAEVRPPVLGLGDPHAGYLRVMHWRRWNTPIARGRGRMDNFVVGGSSARVSLRRIRWCSAWGVLVYTRQRAIVTTRNGRRNYRRSITAAACSSASER